MGVPNSPPAAGVPVGAPKLKPPAGVAEAVVVGVPKAKPPAVPPPVAPKLNPTRTLN